ncbi:MAG: phosphatidylglycerophosphatase A [Kiritimatiellae bacterium]|nr:phosphatidylglycerophosphatase A [Kiritimatiellia bacterium]
MAEWLASGLGLGRIPWMPGTFGTLPGVLLVAGVWPRLTGRLWASVAVALLLPLLGVALCGAAERQLGRKDDRRIIADEFLSFPLAMVGLPVGLDTWWVVVIAFFAFRFFDVLKPWPARACERLAGGWGVVLDDVVAALYALACTHGFYRTIMYYLF